MTRAWRQTLLAMPGIGVALLPKLFCPLCWPLYAAVASSIGLGFLVGTTYLLPITSAFLILTLVVLGFRARQRRGYGPLLIGVAASIAILIGKFFLESNSLMYGGVGFLVVASVWNALPPDTTVQIKGVNQGRLSQWKRREKSKSSVRGVDVAKRPSNS